MISYDRNKWWVLAFAFKGTVIVHMLVRIALFLGLTVLLAVLQYYHYHIPSVNSTLHTLLGTALGLLLVFRTNASYDRYWEGRKLIGSIVTQCRSLMRAASVYCKRDGAEGPEELVQYVSSFVIGLKHILRKSKDTAEISSVLKNPVATEKIINFPNPALASLFMISAWVDARVRDGRLERWQARSIEQYISVIGDSQGGLERICNTPIPFAYAVHTHQFLMLYLVTLPFTMVTTYQFYSLVAVFIISFGLLGIDEAGVEIEDPFGHDDNDLPLDLIFGNIIRDAKVLAELPLQPGTAEDSIRIDGGENSGSKSPSQGSVNVRVELLAGHEKDDPE